MGAAAALAGWLAASAGLRIYLDHFAGFGVTYGAPGAVIAPLPGAEIDSGIQARPGTPAG